MEKKRIKYLFERYYSGTASPDEREEFLKQIAENNRSRAIEALLLGEIRREKGEFSLTEREIRELKNRVYASTPSTTLLRDSVPPKPAERFRLLKRVKASALSYAAVVLLLVGASALYFLTRHKNQPGQTTTIRTAYGEQRQVLLPDSSRVWMNALSTLSYPADFGNHRRDVEISGEVYFEVRRDPEKPFLVKTGEVSVQVLGTQFLLNAYEEEPEIRVSLLTGRVVVQQWDKKGILKPGEQLVLNRKRKSPSDSSALKPDDNGWQIIRFNEKEALDWKNGSFLFNNTDLTVVVRELARWYGFRPMYPEGIPLKRISGEMQQNLPLAGALEVLAAMDIHCRLEGDELIITE